MSIGEHGRAAEKKSAQRLGARHRRGSGCGETSKADFELGEFLVEHKATTAASVRVKHEWLAKVTREAQNRGQTPALEVTFVRGDGAPKRCGAWVMIPEWRFRELLEECE